MKQLIDGLHEALTKVEKDPAIKCAVLTGNGKAFCAGGDLPFLETLADTAVKKAFITKVGQVANVLLQSRSQLLPWSMVLPLVPVLI